MDERSTVEVLHAARTTDRVVADGSGRLDTGGFKYSATPNATPDKRPTDGQPRLTFYTPTAMPVSESDLAEIRSVADQFGGEVLRLEPYMGGVLVGGRSTQEIKHAATLDIVENAIQQVAGGDEKSTLFLGGDPEGHSVQPCFILSDLLDGPTLRELEQVYAFVTGVESTWYFNKKRLYVDTGRVALPHGALDVAEILTRRAVSGTNITVEAHSFKRLPRQ